MNILVTGGAGFIGSHVCERFLKDGHSVVSLDNFNDFYDPAIKKRNIREVSSVTGGRFRSVDGDIRDRNAIIALFKEARPEMVLHLAAMAGVRSSIQDPLLYEEVNIRGTQLLLEACRQNAVKNFVFASSSSVYGNNDKVPFSEDDRVDNPISPYAATKKAGELLAHVFHSLYGMNVCVLRFFTVYGPRQRPDLAIYKFTKLILNGELVPFYGDGNTERDYTYIDDIIDGVVKAAAWTCSGGPKFDVFNLGESHTVSLAELVGCLEKTTKKKARLERLPSQPGDVQRTFADVSKAKKMLQYAPSTDFETGIARFVEWYLKTR